MNVPSTASLLSMGIIVVVVILSGPLVPSVDFDSSPELRTNGASNASVSIVSLPDDQFHLNQTNDESKYSLHAAPLTVKVNYVIGSPILVYELSIPGLSLNVAAVAILQESNIGHKLSVDIKPKNIRLNDSPASTYPGDVSLRIRGNNSSREIYRENVTVVVTDA